MQHKLPDGEVMIFVTQMGESVDELRTRIETIRMPDMTVVKAHGSAAIRINVRSVEMMESFEKQRDAIAEGVAAARRLRIWAQDHYSRMGL